MRVTTSGGLTVASGDNSAFLAAQVRGLVSRGYPAFIRTQGQVVEVVRRDGLWRWEGSPPPYGTGAIITILNETEPTTEGEASP